MNLGEFQRVAAWLWVAVLGCCLPGCDKPSARGGPKAGASDVVPITTARVELQPVDRTLPIVGTLFPIDQATLGAEVEGRVEAMRVDFGQRIQSGQLLAQIDTVMYEAQARQATANLARAQATARNATQELKRIQQLQEEKVASASEFDKVAAALEVAQAEVKAAEANEALAKLKLERSQLKAPFDAAVAERLAAAGDYVKAGSPLYRVVNDGNLKFIVQVPERYAGQVSLGQKATFSVDAQPGRIFTGEVFLLSPEVSAATRSFNVGLKIPNAERKLKASTYARGELMLAAGVPTPLVPLASVASFAGVNKVFVIQNGLAAARTVQTGRVLGGKMEILEGLAGGETVAVDGLTRLFDGAKIRLRDQPAKKS